MVFVRTAILAFMLFAHLQSLGQSKGIIYSIGGHFHGGQRYDIILSVQTSRHQIAAGYYTSQLGTSSGQVTYPGLTFGYRYYPGKMLRKVNGFLSVDYFGQSYRTSTISSETTLVAFGGGVRYAPIPRLFAEATIGYGPYRSEYSDATVPTLINSTQSKAKGVIRFGIVYRFN